LKSKYGMAGFGKGVRNETALLKFHLENVPLHELTVNRLELTQRFYERRPNRQRGKMLKKRSCVNQIKRLRDFVKWLNREPALKWQRPYDLSRYAKVFSQDGAQPEIIRKYTAGVQDVPDGEVCQMVKEALYLFINGCVLLVGTDDVLTLSPQRVHGVELGAPFRQPQEIDIEALGQLHRCVRRVGRVFIQEQCYMPATVARMNLA
jgi:hypothetical protein